MAKRGSDNWKLICFFEPQWSEEYGGAIYPKSGRDLKASKDFLELHPNFFEDEVLQMESKGWYQRFLKTTWWYKPDGKPPMYHPFWGFVQHLDKYAVVEKKQEIIPKTSKVKPTSIAIQCSTCGKVHRADEQCKIESTEEIRDILDKQFGEQK